MGTRATIRFKDGENEYFIYRGKDGYPENVDKDIKEVLQKIKNRWSEPELELLVTFFLGYFFVKEKRLPSYKINPCFHGDESFRYYVEWNNEKKEWKYYFE